MLNEKLKKGLEKLGFPLLETDKQGDASVLLANVVKSRDMRLWHGFPAMLANVNEEHQFEPDKFKKELNGRNDLENAARLVALSGAVYDEEGYRNNWFKNMRNMYTHGQNVNNYKKAGLDTGKAAELFKLYFKPETSRVNELLPMKKVNSLEYALSELFSPKQKELVMKKFKGEKFTKTENEYYSRVVKKRLRAVANSDLQRMAETLVK